MANQHIDQNVLDDHYANIAQADQAASALDALPACSNVDALRAELSHTEARIAYVGMLINDTPRHALDRIDFSNV